MDVNGGKVNVRIKLQQKGGSGNQLSARSLKNRQRLSPDRKKVVQDNGASGVGCDDQVRALTRKPGLAVVEHEMDLPLGDCVDVYGSSLRRVYADDGRKPGRSGNACMVNGTSHSDIPLWITGRLASFSLDPIKGVKTENRHTGLNMYFRAGVTRPTERVIMVH
ncbi:hypothetical protein KL86DPRO_10362 [uncultured delta proteobacterium]|uniref:Uncharacterized protein n=1 Tax=uncultured delta proteobacterium TaxID=34034 RepID=A0A212IZ42_9DELT|nr:hypothetical protein KL86DPRO_10362 [uncultured delta proteobacterium]